jgi:hypothetical protein
MPLINILASGVHHPAAVLEIKNCASHMAEGGEKYTSHIVSLSKPHMDSLDKNKVLTDQLYSDAVPLTLKRLEEFLRVTILVSQLFMERSKLLHCSFKTFISFLQ